MEATRPVIAVRTADTAASLPADRAMKLLAVGMEPRNVRAQLLQMFTVPRELLGVLLQPLVLGGERGLFGDEIVVLRAGIVLGHMEWKERSAGRRPVTSGVRA